MKLYALHDKKARALSAFAAYKSDAVATRDFASGVMADGSMLGKYPDDFELVCIAELVEDTSVQADPVWPIQPLEGRRYEVIVTARQIVDLQRPESAQLSLLKEASNG